MLTFERPGVFLGKAHNEEWWYVVDTTYAQFEKQVIAEWRARYKPTNRPGWVRPLASFGIPLFVVGVMIATTILVPYESWTEVFVATIVLAIVLVVVLLRLADHFWPGNAAVDGHIHAVVPIPPDVAQAASDSTGWLDLWEVSQAIYRWNQAAQVGVVLDGYLEVMHAPDERRVLSEAREQITVLSEKRLSEFEETAEWSTLFHKRLGLEDNGEY